MAARLNLAALSSLTPLPFEKSVYRVVFQSLRGKILSTEGNRYYPGRYHLVGETGVLYSSLKEEIAIKEIERHAPRNMWEEKLVVGEINIRLYKVLDLTQASNLKKLGLSRENLISPDYSTTQAISLAARQAGLQGLIVPSATSQGDNLIVFENNLGEGCFIEIKNIHVLE